jgi:4-hydroxy-4-methyl-2-oxoglutarate aldolase
VTANDALATDLVTRLSEIDACSVSDALDALGLQGSTLGIGPVWAGARVVGRAVTVRLLPWPPPEGVPPVHLGVQAIVASRPGDVIVVDNGGRTGMGSWGGLLSIAAIERGIGGVVLDGACRDVDEARELSFPIFARSAVARTARGRVYEASWGQPVKLDGVTVEMGDIVVADGSGVVIVAAGAAQAVTAKAEELVARESRMRADLRRGVATTAVLGASYQKMLD